MATKVTHEDVISFLQARETELKAELEKISSAIAALGGSVAKAAPIAAAPAAASAAPAKGKPGRKPKAAAAASPAIVEAASEAIESADAAAAPAKGKPGRKAKAAKADEPKKQRANYIPKATWEDAKTLTDKIIFVLNERQDATTEELIESIKDKGINMAETTLKGNVAQYVSILKNKKVLKSVKKEGRQFRYALA